MMGMAPNSVTRHNLSVLVQDGKAPDSVARMMIESGKQNEPFHIFDMDEAHRRIQHFKMMLPRVRIYYAMKSNDFVMMLKLAIAEGTGFDCASPKEIKKVLQLGANPRSIIYAVTMKTPDQMIFAREAGVEHTTFDTVYELEKLKQYWPGASLLLRIRVESNSIYKLGDKFGCEFEEAFDLLDKAAYLGLRVAGVAFHVGSACFSPESYELGLRRARALFDHEALAGRRMTIVDIGGGFLSDKTERVDEVADIVNRNLKELFPDQSVQIMAEPGRYLCDSSTTLYCNILNIRSVKRKDQILNFIYIMDGVYGTLRFSEPWHTVEKFKWSNEDIEDEPAQEVILYGPSGDSTDIVMKNYKVMLPPCSPHDWLIFRIQGAYTTNFATNFSCLPIPLILPVVSLQLWKTLESHSVFKTTDFILNPDFSSALPSTMPPAASTRLLPRLSRESLFLQR